MQNKSKKALMRLWCLMILLVFLPATVLAQNAKKVMGTVVDETGEALIGATVTESGSAKGVITDFDGNFSLEVSSGATAIQVSYVGYKTKTVNIPATGKLTIRMETDETVLQETVVIGYGVQRKSDLTGSVSNVSS
ncbi:MAG: carboxypeptidase-like regulatory domain-containing protein, partial [Aeriscardovia sp.]|nr:carboxypeptidase-like regulatory domain-containing protein [Aeriscardovia sp.]